MNKSRGSKGSEKGGLEKVIIKVIHCKNMTCKNIDFAGICRCNNVTIKSDGTCDKEIG